MLPEAYCITLCLGMHLELDAHLYCPVHVQASVGITMINYRLVHVQPDKISIIATIKSKTTWIQHVLVFCLGTSLRIRIKVSNGKHIMSRNY